MPEDADKSRIAAKGKPPKGLTEANSFICPYCLHRNPKTALRCWYCSNDFYGPNGIYGGQA